jgi:hypothetical protein
LLNPATGTAYTNANGTPLTFSTSQITGIAPAGSATSSGTTGSGG